MPRGPPLTDLEKGQILALHHQLMSLRDISKELGRSVGAVQRFLKNPSLTARSQAHVTGQKLTVREEKAIIRKATTGNYSARDIKQDLNLPVGVRRIQKILSATPHLKYRKMKTAPMMTSLHREKRVRSVRRFISKGDFFWNKVILSDEKKFNLDGPDENACYWHDLRKNERFFSKKQNGGATVMVWGAISPYGVSPLVFLNGNQNSGKYCETLDKALLPFAAEMYGEMENWVYQQDGASIHRSRFTRSWLNEKGVRTMDWPAKSPDLNIIENIWGIMARRVYLRQRQFDTIEQLKEVIEDVWAIISGELLQKLYRSIPRRMLAVLDGQGRATKY
ncbi:unnamed protein product [Chondrus crispus]|uniref:Tc1-like transposase DDE domain-containing protein n=1 Tax=Chondrus crispus TaxID=2769 RepID=R7QC24_CHOCR|nr:unnamed protein product [Chondrus crispus]CDF35348.1 unnamed protein product [Chondrus crispus]|eukprot:XP_005715167.1 unnamed protein product [Chondrus crispus]